MPELTILLFIVGLILGFVIAYILIQKIAEAKYKIELQRWKHEMEESIRKETLERSRAVLKGKISEQILPLLPEFKYNSADARFLGNPIDYIIFNGYSEYENKDKPMDIIFMDVKKGKGKLTKGQEKIKEAVEKKKVKWETLNLD